MPVHRVPAPPRAGQAALLLSLAVVGSWAQQLGAAEQGATLPAVVDPFAPAAAAPAAAALAAGPASESEDPFAGGPSPLDTPLGATILPPGGQEDAQQPAASVAEVFPSVAAVPAPGGAPAPLPSVEALSADFPASPGGSGQGDGAAFPGLLPGVSPEDASDRLADPSQRVGRLVSLLAPPAGSVPALTPEQQAMVPLLQPLRQGTATVAYQREVGPLDAANWACGIAYLNDYFTQHFVALSLPMFRTGELCGACVRMWCVDSVCEDAMLRDALFMIVDSCLDCGPTDVVASAPGLANLTGGVSVDLTPRVQVAWTLASCAPLIQGGIRLWPSDRIAPEFLGLQFSNLKSLLVGVSINGIRMQRTEYGYWVIDTPGRPIPLRPPYELILVSIQTERISVRIASLRPQDLGINFSDP